MGENLPVVSLFSGAGGLDLAVARADARQSVAGDAGSGLLRVSVATDHNEPALKTLKANFRDTRTLTGDIREIPTEEILAAAGLSPGEAVLVVGGPPCTPFSKSGFWLEQKRESRDPNASLLDEYVRVVRESRPEAFILENVQGLTYKTHKLQFGRLLEGLGELGYNPQWKVLLAADYGVPQLRRRVFVVGRRDGARFQFPEPTHSGWSEHTRIFDRTKIPHITASKAFEELPTLVGGSMKSWKAVTGSSPRRFLLARTTYGTPNVMGAATTSSGAAGTGRFCSVSTRIVLDYVAGSARTMGWPVPLGERSRHLGRGAGSPTAVNEMLRLMSFPDDFTIDGTRADVQRQLGNAVPMELGKAVVRALMNQLGYLTQEGESRLVAEQ